MSASPTKRRGTRPTLGGRLGTPGLRRLMPAKPLQPLCNLRRCNAPSHGVVSCQIGEAFGGGLVSEASQACSIVVSDEGEDAGLAFGVACEACAVSGVVAGLRQGAHGLAEAAVEALDHAVGLGPVGPGQPVGDAARGAEAVEGVLAAGPGGVAVAGAVAEAVGELGAVARREEGLS